MAEGRLDILVVDDDDVDVEVIERAVRGSGKRFRVLQAEDGAAALAILRGQAPQKINRPYIILLDLNMPRMNGFEFLDALRSDINLSDSIVFVITSSDSQSDRTRAYNEHVAGFMVKAKIGAQFCRLTNLLDEYATTVLLPA